MEKISAHKLNEEWCEAFEILQTFMIAKQADIAPDRHEPLNEHSDKYQRSCKSSASAWERRGYKSMNLLKKAYD